MTARTCPQCGDTPRRARAVYCSQACLEAARGERRVARLVDALHLLRFGLRLDVVAARLGIATDTLLEAVKAGQAGPGFSDLDLQALRRLVRADRARTREEADAQMSDRAREWRWSS